METKTCTTCKEDKPLKKYEKTGVGKHKGRYLRNICRKCINKRRNTYRSTTYREKCIIALKQYKRNPIREKEYQEEYRKKNKKLIKVRRRKSYESNRQFYINKMVLYRLENLESLKLKALIRFEKASKELYDWYVINLLQDSTNLKIKEIRKFPNLIFEKREQVKLKRLLENEATCNT